MSYLPTICDNCHSVTLVHSAGCAGGEADCVVCGDTVRVVPSCNYSAADVATFQELSNAIAESHLSPSDAQSMAEQVSLALRGSFHASAKTITSQLPNLAPLQSFVSGGPMAKRRALRMLKTIFDGLSSLRRSGFISTRARVATER